VTRQPQDFGNDHFGNDHSRNPLWREEFSVRAADERYVGRRQFAKFLTLTSLAMFAGNLWILVKGLTIRAPVFRPQVVARIGDLPIDGVKLFNYPTPKDPCLMIRTAEDTYVAYSQVCTHLSCAVYFDARTRHLECPCHRGSFSVTDGSVIAGPPPRPLPRVELERQGDALVAVGLKAE
jgi:nitrite reductase/ring-hydroxylating ferredoxin subunit